MLCARIRLPLVWAGTALLVAAAFGRLPYLLAVAVLVTGLALYLRLGTLRREPVIVRAPVAGRWRALNSPATRVPSHGLHAYGQTYAIDLVFEPVDAPRPATGWWPLARHPADFPGFGRPVFAPGDGMVVRVHDRERDHWSRSSWPALVYLILEGWAREVFGPSRVLGNHVVLRLGDGVYAVLAHLRRGSVRVATGQTVIAGGQLAECGNSGNSSEPHVHFQLMDHRSVLFAAGLPVRFERFEAEGEVQVGLPQNDQLFVVPPAPATSQLQKPGSVY